MRSAVPVAAAAAAIVACASPEPLTSDTAQAIACGGPALNGHATQCDVSGKLVGWTSFDALLAANQAWWAARPNVNLVDRNGGNPLSKSPLFGYSYLCSGIGGSCSPLGAPAGWPSNPAGNFAMVFESALAYSAYRGDASYVTFARTLIDWQLGHGLTSSTDSWASVPYASGQHGSYDYGGASSGTNGTGGDGIGYIEPDKVGALGWALALSYRHGGPTTHRDAAVRFANQLAAHVRTTNLGTARSPWPYRVRASDDTVRAAYASDQYCGNVVDPLKLFDELLALDASGALAGAPGYSAAAVASWQSARSTALGWLLGPSGPIRDSGHRWNQYFEDVPSDETNTNNNQLNAGETARYLMDHPEVDPSWQTHVAEILAWVEAEFGDTLVFGARPIREQNAFFYAMGSHTARFASVNARFAELTGDAAARERALRSFAWATYMVRADGMTIDGPQVNNIWFTDSWGDFVRHFVYGMAALPELAPPGQSRLLRAASLAVRDVVYGSNAVSYTTAAPAGIDVLRLAFVPTTVRAGGVALAQRSDLAAPGWTFDASTDATGQPRNILRIRHATSGAIEILGAPPTAPVVTLTAPAAGAAFEAPATLALAASATLTAGRTLVSVTFRAGSTTLCTAAASGTTASCTAGVALGDGAYTITADAVDSAGEHGTAAVAVTVAGPPSVTIASPASGATLGAGANTLVANASAGTGRTVARVEFFEGGVSLCATTTGTSCTWTATAGTHTLVARVTESGASARTADSAPVTVTVTPGGAGQIVLGSSAIGDVEDWESTGNAAAFAFGATAPGTLDRLHLYVTAGNAATQIALGVYAGSGGAPGARLGQCTATATAGAAGWVSCALPSPQPSVTAGTTYWIAALAAAGGGEIRWRRVAGGSYAYMGANLTSLPATWASTGTWPGQGLSAYATTPGAVSTPPTAAVTSPTSGATIPAGTDLAIAASATAAAGRTIARVELVRDGATVICSDNTSPYTCNWSAVPAGSYVLTAVAYDSAGESGVSSPVPITVVAGGGTGGKVGNDQLGTTSDFENAGVAAAFPFTASASGPITTLHLYLDAATAAGSVTVGLYANSTGGTTPGTLLRSCTLSPATLGAWNSCAISSLSITAGTVYWIAALHPGGQLHWRQTSGGGTYRVQPNLTALPATWTGTGGFPGSNLSAWGD